MRSTRATNSSRPRSRSRATPTSRPPIPSSRGSTSLGPAIRGSTCRPAPDWAWDRPTRSSWLLSPTSSSPDQARRLRHDRQKPKPSLAATPPPAVKKGEKDIFDDTDFEVDVPSSDADSDDKTVQLEAASDFDLEDSDTGSEVFAIDEEAVDQNASTAMAPSAFAEDEDDEEDDGFDSAVSSEMTAGWSSSESSAGPERSSPAMVLSREAEPEWSGLWVGMLGAHDAVALFRLVRRIWTWFEISYEFQAGGTMGSGLVRMIAGMFGG